MVFLKAPRLGTVKTRLADAVGEKTAQSIYRELVEGQMARLSGRYSMCVQYAPQAAAAEMSAWLGADVSYQAQCEGDLGARLSSAIHAHFQAGAARLMCIGGDCPGLAVQHIAAADSALDQGADVVLGPTEDGDSICWACLRPMTAYSHLCAGVLKRLDAMFWIMLRNCICRWLNWRRFMT